ncbi:MAG: TetR/AcrR family transcriptional regulator [Halioglobus sp.]
MNTKVSAEVSGSSDGRRKKRPGLEVQRRHILEAAVDLFGKRGSRAVSISQLCAAANVSRPTFYKCFADKEALIYALYEEAVNQPVQRMLAAGMSGNESEEDGLKASLDLLFDSIFEQARYAQLVFMESNDPASPAFHIVNDAFERVAGRMMKAAVKRGREKPSRVYLKSLMAANQWIVMDAIRKGPSAKARREAKAAAWQLTRGLA